MKKGIEVVLKHEENIQYDENDESVTFAETTDNKNWNSNWEASCIFDSHFHIKFYESTEI